MTNANDFAFNDSATRLQSVTPNGIEANNPPLTKREYFAAMALQGCLASGFQTTMDKHAESAIEAADALIKALNETK